MSESARQVAVLERPSAAAVAPPAEAKMAGTAGVAEVAASADELIEAELLVEEISIDGMCGVY